MTEPMKPGQVVQLGIQTEGVTLLALTGYPGEMLRLPGKMHPGRVVPRSTQSWQLQVPVNMHGSRGRLVYMRRQSWPIARRAMRESTFAGDS